jgi:hypothetical protein
MDTTPPPAEPLPPGYTVRRLQPGDAAGVTRCVREVYGDSYIHAEVYHPNRLLRLNETGELVSVVALDAAGEVVGHYALERAGLGCVAEEGEALVLPAHRHRHLMEAMRGLLEEEALRLGLTGLFGEAVTNHVYTQRVHEHYGLRPCGVSLGALPRTFHNMPAPLPQRMSVLVGFKYLRPPQRVAAHVPDRHRDLCARIYEQFQLAVEFREPGPAEGAGEVSVDYEEGPQEAVIRVRRVGADTAAAVGRARRELSGAEVVFLDLPLAQAGTPEVCRAAEEEGFFFSGIGPSFAADGDILRLQRLNVDLDVALLQIESAFARELVAYVARERDRVGTGNGR